MTRVVLTRALGFMLIVAPFVEVLVFNTMDQGLMAVLKVLAIMFSLLACLISVMVGILLISIED